MRRAIGSAPAGMRQRITVVNEERGKRKMLLLDRQTCRLSTRQARECFQELAVPGYQNAGEIGEYPLIQRPPECDGVPYRVVKAGPIEGAQSNVYFVPVDAARDLLERLGPATA